LIATQVSWKSRGRLLSLALLGGMTLGPAVGLSNNVAHAQAVPQSWLTLRGPWLCRTWASAAAASAATVAPLDAIDANAAFRYVSDSDIPAVSGPVTVHCTQQWHVDGAGHLISDMPEWVPTSSDGWSADRELALYQPRLRYQVTIRQKPVATRRAPPPPAPPPPVAPPSPGGGYNPWGPVPGHPGYGYSDFAGDPYSSYFGVCTWYAWDRHQNEPLLKLGNAAAWAWNAPTYGLPTGSTPAVGATVVFQPGVEGAGDGGHVAHVEQVLGGGWFIVSEMNFGLNGGGWGRVDWRYAYVTSGVTFIY
jgi:CHAP domain-containing protein